jgi:hypothetical protein
MVREILKGVPAPPTETPVTEFDPYEAPALEQLSQIINTRRNRIEKVRILLAPLLQFIDSQTRRGVY